MHDVCEALREVCAPHVSRLCGTGHEALVHDHTDPGVVRPTVHHQARRHVIRHGYTHRLGHQAQAVTETKVDAIVESLARQEKIQEKTNDQISALVQALLAKQ